MGAIDCGRPALVNIAPRNGMHSSLLGCLTVARVFSSGYDTSIAIDSLDTRKAAPEIDR